MSLFSRRDVDTVSAVDDARRSSSRGYLDLPFITEIRGPAEEASQSADCRHECCDNPSISDGKLMLDRVRDEVNDHDLRLLKVEQRLTSDERRMAAYEARMQRLESRIDAFLAARTRERPDIATTVHSVHRAVADEFRGIVEQRLQSIAREQATRPEFARRYPDRERVPQLISMLCKSLFGDGTVPYIGKVQEALNIADGTPAHESLASVRMAVRSLRKRSQEAGLTAKWEFGHGSEYLDKDTQEAWPTCDPTGPVVFVIAPAYLVDGQVYARQFVFTSRKHYS